MHDSTSISERASKRVPITWSGQNASDPVYLYGRTAGVRMYLPAGFAGNQLSAEEEVAEGEWKEVFVDGAKWTVGVTADKVNVLHGNGELFGMGKVRFVSNVSETATGTLIGVA